MLFVVKVQKLTSKTTFSLCQILGIYSDNAETAFQPYLKAYHIYMQINNILGSGEFGIVYRVKLIGYLDDSVAVKRVRDNSSKDSIL